MKVKISFIVEIRDENADDLVMNLSDDLAEDSILLDCRDAISDGLIGRDYDYDEPIETEITLDV